LLPMEILSWHGTDFPKLCCHAGRNATWCPSYSEGTARSVEDRAIESY
jgi:hypothetical protein